MWVAAYRRWRVKEMWGVDDAALKEFGQGMVVPGPPSPRKVAKAASRVPGMEGESSVTASSPTRMIKAPNLARVVVPSVSLSRKRQRPSERERIVLKVPRKAATMAATTAAAGGAVDPLPRIIPLGPIPNTPEGVVHELVATRKQLEAAQEELARGRASEKSYEKAVADWKALATDLRQQVEAAAVRERSTAEGYQRALDRWRGTVDSLHQQVREHDDEVDRLGHALSQAMAQGQGAERDQLLIARLKRRVAREYPPFLDVARVLTYPRPRSEHPGPSSVVRARDLPVPRACGSMGCAAPTGGPIGDGRRREGQGLGGTPGGGS